MRPCTLHDVALLSGGEVLQGDPALVVNRLHTDTRTLREGDCFVALRGERFDGHRFVGEVARHGAVAALVAEPPASGLAADLGLVQVGDTLLGLQQFAAGYRRLLPVHTIGITGSSGKTSTKELIAAVLRTRFPTKATHGNLNNHIGVPLTLLELEPDDLFGVVEMGMNHRGEIALLAGLAAPTVAVLSSIGPAHIEYFESQAAIAEEKADLLAALPANGVAILNSDDEWSRRIAHRSPAPVVWVGDGPGSTWRATGIEITADGLGFELHHQDESIPVRLPVFNRIMVGNALLAAAVGDVCGLTLAEIALGLASVKLPGARMQIVTARGASIINDSYNANPVSMKAALVALAEFPGASRRLAVLGSMGELGRHAEELHRGIGEFAARQRVDFLIAVGPHAEAYRIGAAAAGIAPENIALALDADEAARALHSALRKGDAVLVKGSHFMGLDKTVAAIAGKETP